MTAPSIKEALEKMSRALKELQAYVWGECPSLLDEDRGGNARLDIDVDEALELAEAALATLQPSGEKREAITNLLDELIEAARYVEHAHHNYSKREQRDFQAARLALNAAIDDAILAPGLVQDEAGWRDINTAPKDGTTILVIGQPSQIEGVKIGAGVFTAYWDDIDSSFCLSAATWQGPFISPSHWMPLPAPPIRSARTGG